MQITNDVKYVGVNDRITDLFEGQYIIPNGISYNSYAVIDEKIAVFDSVDARFANEWLSNIENTLNGRSPDYLIVQHMEPDHSSSISIFAEKYPDAKIVSSAKSFVMMKNFFGNDFADKQIVVGEGDGLSLGKHEFKFITAPMVHWPEVIMTYDTADKILFSADAFGKFGALDEQEDWACEARRYYIGIVGKYGVQVQSVLKKAASLDIKIICPLHGPVLNENLEYYLNLYNIWSSYQSESKGVLIAYTSVYGNTKKAVELLKEKLLENGCEKVAVNDLARCDMAEAVEDAFRYDRIVFATTTYNADIFPFMRTFIDHLTERNFSNKRVAFIENGSWAPMATKVMKVMLEKSKNLTYCENEVKIFSALNDESKEKILLLAKELCN
ncbi:MAG: FprA family A-type flavoprotein [Ruminococcaceae bacterium]|nr:FprA family A-type flavoprotein [Oscillospiraceae bacterium]